MIFGTFNKKFFKQQLDKNGLRYKDVANILTNIYNIKTTEMTIRTWLITTKIAIQPKDVVVKALSKILDLTTDELYVKNKDEDIFNIELFRESLVEHKLNYAQLEEKVNKLIEKDDDKITFDIITSWLRVPDAISPTIDKIFAMADYFKVPSLYFFVNGELELQKNVNFSKTDFSLDNKEYEGYLKKIKESNKKTKRHLKSIADEFEFMSIEQIKDVYKYVQSIKKN